MTEARPRILVTGATGYIGGRLALRLLELGYRVRCGVRDPGRLRGRPGFGSAEVVRADPLDFESLLPAMEGTTAAYYLIHSMAGGADFHERDVTAARAFGAAARDAGVRRIIYLGGLGDPGAALSSHMRSRHGTGDALREAGVPVTEFRAGVIVGSGSLSFEIVRYLTERLPIMICPRWVYVRTQPIAIGDVLAYLTAALDHAESERRIVEIGGAEVLSWGGMLLGYARARGLKRWLLPVPVLTPRLSSYWVHLVTPIPASIARPLVEGLRCEAVVREHSAARLFPAIRPVGYAAAVEAALEDLKASAVETAWSDALASSLSDGRHALLAVREGMVIERRRLRVRAPADVLFRTVAGLGGARGWLHMNWAWRLRGGIDRLIGGVGLRRGRRDPNELRVGDALDFWRVEAYEPGAMMRLRAEMKLPGQAWLEFEIRAETPESASFSQTAYFAPRGLGGWLYWYGLYPIHRLIFSGMIRAIGRAAEARGTG